MGWREDVVQAVQALGGEADLSDIYDWVKKQHGDNLSATYDATIRQTIESNSSDSEVWREGTPDLFRKVRRGRWALRTPAIPKISEVMDAITKQDVLDAIHALDADDAHPFGPSTAYDLVYEGRTYPPKAVVGLAARRQLGRPLQPAEFSGGLTSKCFEILRKHAFEVVKKASSPESEADALPDSPSQAWFEFLSDHNHGGTGWELGRCLWSPSRSTRGADWFSPMRDLKPGDIVIHSEVGKFIGYSKVKASFREMTEEPPDADRWKGMAPYYRVELENFTQFKTPRSLRGFLEAFDGRIRHDRSSPDRPKFYPFVVQNGRLQKFEGAYVSPCTPPLYELLQSYVNGDAAVPPETAPTGKYWVISLAGQAPFWNEFQEQGLFGIGYDYLGDLGQFDDLTCPHFLVHID